MLTKKPGSSVLPTGEHSVCRCLQGVHARPVSLGFTADAPAPGSSSIQHDFKRSEWETEENNEGRAEGWLKCQEQTHWLVFSFSTC